MKIFNYLKEIKNRSFIIIYTIGLNISILFYYKNQLAYILGQHQENFLPYFISTNLTEIFLSFFKLDIFLAFYFTYPILLLQLILFILPGLYKYEYKIIRNGIIISFILYLCCTSMTYKIFLPYCWRFFTSFEIKAEDSLIGIHLETKLNDYLDFFINILTSLNFLFHFFLIFAFFLKGQQIKTLIKNRKIFYIFFFLLATIFTPPDVISQLVLGNLLIICFEIFLFSLFLFKNYEKGE